MPPNSVSLDVQDYEEELPPMEMFGEVLWPKCEGDLSPMEALEELSVDAIQLIELSIKDVLPLEELSETETPLLK